MTNPPTPPRPAVPEMPKANHEGILGDTACMNQNRPKYRKWRVENGTTTIERYATDLATQLAESRAECERLREALSDIANGNVDYRNGSYEAQSLANELYAIQSYAYQALTPKETTDEH